MVAFREIEEGRSSVNPRHGQTTGESNIANSIVDSVLVILAVVPVLGEDSGGSFGGVLVLRMRSCFDIHAEWSLSL